MKNTAAMPGTQETWIQSLGWEDAGGGNGNPLQYSCLENPMERGAWRDSRGTGVTRGGASHGGRTPWGRKELDTAEVT